MPKKRKKLKDWLFIGIKYLSVSIFSIVILSPLLDVTLGNPFRIFIYNIFYPPQLNFTIIPNYYPENGWITIDAQNIGDKPLSDFFIDYQFLCYMNESQRVSLSKQVLQPGEAGYFKFYSPRINMNCSFSTNPLIIKFYHDKKGRCYNEFVSGTSNVCMYCRSQVNISAIEFQGSKNITKKFELYYPFFDGKLVFEGEVGSCLPYENATNKNELIFDEHKTVATTVLDFSTACLMGKDPNWCQTYGYLKYPEIKEID